MTRHYIRRTAIRTEQERQLKVKTVKHEKPDVEVLARIIAQLAVEDPLGLAIHPHK